ncbi:MAG: amino acid adenylation domain-containing protein [Eggerthellaceae bacterium]|nr:amino acid adenylation domain-containing protein [Eggerthellaceae bacterium]
MIQQHSVLEYLEQSAFARPDAIAVTDEHGQMTYSELLSASKAAGCALAQYDVAGHPVIVLAEKSIETLRSFFGILYAGGFYVPVDPSVPDSRLESMFETLEHPYVITDADGLERVSSVLPEASSVDIASIAAPVNQALLDAIRQNASENDPAYVLFTSGSTGTPKGVCVSHRAIIDFIDCFVDTFGFTEGDIFANQAPFDFDVSVKDIYSSMCVGGTLAIVPRPLFSPPAALIDYVNAQNATVMIWAVAALCLISSLHGLDYSGLPTVNKVLFSGEVMPMRHLRTWMERLPEALFVNLYGPTEITCNCTYHIVDRARAYEEGLPLGEVFPNREVLVLDASDHLITQPDEVGEMCVRGASLALGYYGQPEQTAAAFVQNPLRPDEPDTMYRTGDLARYSTDGELYFCGRKDNQIKHLGHRIELEEIDVAFERCEGVTRCRSAFDPEKSRIHAFYEGDIDEAAVIAQAQEALPVFMIPSTLSHVDDMPLTKNGKVDRKALLVRYLEEKKRAREARKAARREKRGE